ncbi:MAG TPA: very short patch repair endonuclease [Pyrinomonadaceae bacterium]|nr:very short patch repair endonuclease [Pyrinomonadaceae bacterium]
MKALRFDNFQPSSEKASRIASRIRSENSKAEIQLRSAIWRMGFRFRKNYQKLPGKPDVVFIKERVAVFCDGDFWHGRDWAVRKQKVQKGSNAPYWISKIEANIERDKRRNKELRKLGWKVARIWETDILKDPQQAARKVVAFVEFARAKSQAKNCQR